MIRIPIVISVSISHKLIKSNALLSSVDLGIFRRFFLRNLLVARLYETSADGNEQSLSVKLQKKTETKNLVCKKICQLDPPLYKILFNLKFKIYTYHTKIKNLFGLKLKRVLIF